jgi:hypothetical protein
MGRPGIGRREALTFVHRCGPKIAFGVMRNLFVSYTALIESDSMGEGKFHAVKNAQ